ncbi:HAMP domain-containing histidine kinase [Candidatus Fermentibacteria bacterium]|nr:HAMP domain-containing histidine kinase [Candidatus Fermentibacteria bacterium]
MHADASVPPAVIRLAAVGRLVIPVSHDISNPLAVVLGRIQIHQARGSGGMPQGPAGLDGIYEHALLVSEKVHTIGSLAREAAQPGDPTPTVLSDHVAEIGLLLGRHLSRRGLELEYALPAATPPVLVRPVDLKLCVAEVLLALCGAVSDPTPLRISADVRDRQVHLSIAAAGIDPGAVPMPDESGHLMALFSGDGLALSAGEGFIISMPAVSLTPPSSG